MRSVTCLLVLLPVFLFAQEVRYTVPLDAKTFPQATPQQTLASLLLAVEQKRIDYLVAHLADPVFIDERVKTVYGGQFKEQVADTRTRLDPSAVKLLQRLAKEGEWKIADKEAHLSAKGIEDRSVYLKKVGERWVIENKQSP